MRYQIRKNLWITLLLPNTRESPDGDVHCIKAGGFAVGLAAMKILLPEQKKLIHECLIPIRWGDMDALGHVNNSVYLQYMDVARVDWSTQSGFPISPVGCGLVVVHVFCNFHRQFEYPGQVRLKMYAKITKIGRASCRERV